MASAQFETWLRSQGKQPSTIRLKLYWLGRFAETVPLLLNATTDDVVAWLAAGDWAPETRRSAQSALRDFYQWAHEEDLIPKNPTSRMRAIRVPPGKPRPTPERSLEQALADADEVDRCLVLLMAYAGLRRQEVAELRCSSITAEGLRIKGKGGRVRIVPIHPRLEVALEARVQAVGGTGWLFPSTHRPGWHISADRVYRHVKDLTGGYSPHTLRHRFGTQVYRTSKDIRVTQELLGHSSVSTTQRYVLVEEDALRQAVRNLA